MAVLEKIFNRKNAAIFEENIDRQRNGDPPAGKGDRYRTTNKRRFDKNFDQIVWSSKQ